MHIQLPCSRKINYCKNNKLVGVNILFHVSLPIWRKKITRACEYSVTLSNDKNFIHFNKHLYVQQKYSHQNDANSEN